MTKSPERQRAEGLARMLLRIMTYPIPFGIGFFVWFFGFDVHPQRIGFACIVAGIWVLLSGGSAWLVYYAGMKNARKL